MVTLVILDLGWVHLDFECSTVCPAEPTWLSPVLIISHISSILRGQNLVHWGHAKLYPRF